MNLVLIKSILKQKKINIIYLIIFTVLFLSLIIISQLYFHIKDHVIINIKEKYQNREIYIKTTNSNTYKNDISDIGEIETIYIYMNPINIYIHDIGNLILNSGVIEHIPKIIIGRNLDSNNTNEIVISNYINNDQGKINTFHLLNKMINIEYKDKNNNIKKYLCKVVGIYNSNNNGSNNIYISHKNIIDLKDSDYEEYIALADKQENITNIIDKLKNLGVEANLFDNSLQVELEMYESLLNLFKGFIYIIIVFYVSIICLLTYDLINKEINTIALMKSIGYKTINIIINIYFIIIFISVASYIISIPITLIILYILNIIFNIKISINLTILILIITIHLIISLIIELSFLFKIKNINIIKLLKL